MGCNCGKNRDSAAQPRRMATSGSSQKFVIVHQDGRREQFGSRLEADAANARNGYRGVVKPLGGN